MKSLQKLKRLIKGRSHKLKKQTSPIVDHGPSGISQVGHRKYVGGLWEEVGKLQFNYMLEQGLKPHHYLLDVACGSLRAGIYFIPYLDSEHYLGIDKEQSLIEAGITHELSKEIYEQKKPRFVVSEDFEFEKFGVKPNFAIAQSLFTHLPPEIIKRCLFKLSGNLAPGGAFYATFWEAEEERKNPDQPHDHGYFAYTIEQMRSFANPADWHMDYIGEWGHPRSQKMLRYTPKLKQS